MSERQETVREVCAEMREHSIGDASDTYYDRFAWEVLIDRIISANEREMAAKDAEIARLKAALNPVMECDPNEDINHTIYEWGLRNSNAVREAQRIMKEGDAK